ncbi:MAG: response regulator transcription factor [bacterium]
MEDEKNLAEGLAYNLRCEGYEVAIAGDGWEAIRMFEEGGWSLIVLDLMLPRMDGLDVARRVRQNDLQVPILVLTAKGREEDRVEGLASGADDYLTKPFHLKELLLRVQGMLRRRSWYRQMPPAGAPYHFGASCWVDFASHRAAGPSGPRELTDKETGILRLLVEREGEVVTREEMLTTIWGYHPDVETRTVDNFIRRLRTYFEQDPSAPRHILSVRGMGYRFER